jgi:hypothetical protein
MQEAILVIMASRCLVKAQPETAPEFKDLLFLLGESCHDQPAILLALLR